MQKLSEILNLELAWKRVKNDLYNDLVPDILKFRDVDYDVKDTLASLKARSMTDYEPSALLRLDVPKKSYTLRPASYMIPEDRIVYQAVIDFISSKIEEPPSEACFSYRLNRRSNSSNMFQFWKNNWLEMRKKMREVFKDGYCCLLKTDIASYFEQIDHGIFIEHIVNGKVREGQIAYLLHKLLTKWAVSEVKHIGIPIGCDASSYIGNVYLRDVDKNMIRRGFKYFRYSDEILVLTKNEREAKKVIRELIHQLRDLHLNLQDAKTRILTDLNEIAQEIGSGEDDKTKIFDYEFDKRKKSKAKESKELIKGYKHATKNGKAKVGKLDITKFKWCH